MIRNIIQVEHWTWQTLNLTGDYTVRSSALPVLFLYCLYNMIINTIALRGDLSPLQYHTVDSNVSKGKPGESFMGTLYYGTVAQHTY